jgi:transcriptional regulator with XRE-family HTH domain
MQSIDVISANLRLLRELRGRLGQLELAEQVGVSRRTIARLEGGEVADPGVGLARRLAEVLGVTLSMLTEAPLRPMTLPLPKKLCDRLSGPDGARLLEKMVRAAD